ncbi:dehydrogenase-like protein [Tothia fuscella]|uniref:Dehydrogenase-like protein n=1 Tax=Tothia fuscella TaxID=1048955 RepID=A0A9P4NWQ5_9PEZI|nr:dehydrogenase-like protein [Tothia fuscella]
MSLIVIGIAITISLLFAYLYHLSSALSGVPEEVLKLSPHRWTEQECRETYEKVKEKPIDFNAHLPPKQDRRYIVVGGSGLVGGDIILHLLARGQSPKSIRLIDFRPPFREDMLSGPAGDISFYQADISSTSSINAAFSHPWPKELSTLPLTVFHTAAVINANERHISLLHKCSAVNTLGAKNVVAAAKSAGCSILIATSSASLAVRPPRFWLLPWEKWPKGYFQLLDEKDAEEPVRKHGEYFGNYGFTKALGEKLILEADEAGFRTGSIRPGNGIYGNKYDQTSGNYLRRGDVPTWISHIRQNFVSGHNISNAHLLFEAALLTPSSQKCSGKAFLITDPNPTISFSDIYTLLTTLSATGFKIQLVPPILLFLLSYPIEMYHTLQCKYPKSLPALGADLKMLQPTLFNISNGHFVCDDSAARRSVQEGGLGYKGVCTTLEGMTMQVLEWNREHEGLRKEEEIGEKNVVRELKNMGAVGGKT